MNFIKKFTLFGLLGLFLIALPVIVFAGRDQAIYISEDEIVDGNFIRFGSIIDINGPVNGDVIVAGNFIEISGPVAGDVIAIGSTIKITGPVQGSIRVIGTTIEISGSVARNVWAAGTVISIGKDAEIGWDVYAAGVDVSIKGRVSGNVKLSGENVVIGNEIKKDSVIEVGQNGQAILLPTAKLAGNLKLKSSNQDQLVVSDGAEVLGTTNFEKYTPSKKSNPFFSFGLFKLVLLFSFLIIGLLVVTFLPKYMLKVDTAMTTKVGASIGWGFVLLIVTPVVVFMLAITLIGIPLAVILLLTYLVTFFVSVVFAGFSLGLYLLNQFNKDKKYKGSLIWALVLGLVILMILISLPLVGWLVKLIAMVWAVGAMMRVELEIMKSFR